MRKYTVNQVKSKFMRILKHIKAGEEVVILNGTSPVAKLIPYVENVRKVGWCSGVIWMADDFDAPLDDFKSYA